jgi:hypothetical protein
MIPDPITMIGLKKHQPFTFYLLLNLEFEKEGDSNFFLNSKILASHLELSYCFNNSSQFKSTLQLSPALATETNSYHKLAIMNLI